MNWELLFTEEAMSVVAGLVGAFLLALKVFKSVQNRFWIYVAYKLADEISKRTKNTIDDKAALFLKLLSGFVEEKGKTFTEKDAEKAKLVFDALHAKEQK